MKIDITQNLYIVFCTCTIATILYWFVKLFLLPVLPDWAHFILLYAQEHTVCHRYGKLLISIRGGCLGAVFLLNYLNRKKQRICLS